MPESFQVFHVVTLQMRCHQKTSPPNLKRVDFDLCPSKRATMVPNCTSATRNSLSTSGGTQFTPEKRSSNCERICARKVRCLLGQSPRIRANLCLFESGFGSVSFDLGLGLRFGFGLGLRFGFGWWWGCCLAPLRAEVPDVVDVDGAGCVLEDCLHHRIRRDLTARGFVVAADLVSVPLQRRDVPRQAARHTSNTQAESDSH